MADRKRCFMVYPSALNDDRLMALAPAVRWAWVALGTHTAEHGTGGKVTVNPANPVLRAEMGVDEATMLEVIRSMPNIDANPTPEGAITIRFRNWSTYSGQTPAADRMRRLRDRNSGVTGSRDDSVTAVRSNGEVAPSLAVAEARKPENVRNAKSNAEAFEVFWLAYPKEHRHGKHEAKIAWGRLQLTPEKIARIMASLEAWKKSHEWTKDDGKFVPWPQKFLNRHRWEEVPKAAKPSLKDLWGNLDEG